jgi:hypothetical protein
MTALFYPCEGLFVYSADFRELYLVEVDQFNDPKVKQQAPFSLSLSISLLIHHGKNDVIKWEMIVD